MDFSIIIFTLISEPILWAMLFVGASPQSIVPIVIYTEHKHGVKARNHESML